MVICDGHYNMERSIEGNSIAEKEVETWILLVMGFIDFGLLSSGWHDLRDVD